MPYELIVNVIIVMIIFNIVKGMIVRKLNNIIDNEDNKEHVKYIDSDIEVTINNEHNQFYAWAKSGKFLGQYETLEECKDKVKEMILKDCGINVKYVLDK